MVCPECKAEYRRGFTRCSDCDVALVEHLPESEEVSEPLEPVDADSAEPDEVQPVFNPITCPRCEQELEHVGTRKFSENSNWGELAELFVERERFDIYICPNCGRVEFFVEGIGDQYRPH